MRNVSWAIDLKGSVNIHIYICPIEIQDFIIPISAG